MCGPLMSVWHEEGGKTQRVSGKPPVGIIGYAVAAKSYLISLAVDI